MSLHIAETTSTPSHPRKRNESFPFQNSALRLHLSSPDPVLGHLKPDKLQEDPSQRSRTQDTVLQRLDMATYEVDPDIGLDPDDPDYWRALHFKLHLAVFHNDVAAVKESLSYGADINLKSHQGFTALEWADYLKHMEVAKCLLQTMNIKLHGFEELLKHVRAKREILVRALLEMGCSGMLAKNKRLHKGLILQACRVGTAAIFKLLIDCVPGYMITDYKQVYLQVAASERNDDVLVALRERARQEQEWRENYFRPSTPVTPVQLPPRDLEYEKVFDEFINPDAYLP
ncbi:hypothetical protein CNMCM6106_003049 [Aspergillus hiratsukae]|uniref:Ankyrin repeat protein n=1 Tax=Aspergillus hiratsukae TaxID=1194566 RepID=A0A8H6UYM8_9EURO|nr:hypothetical protein CNMCM6106_003049 [Aspergillus hiratsukae]